MENKEPYYLEIPTSMCDFEDFYEWVAETLPDSSRIVEVGVADGYSSLMLAHSIKKLGKNFHLTMIDNCDYGRGDQANTIMNNIIKSGLGEHISFMQYGSLDASCKFNDHALDFVFVDASHKYEETKADIRLWYRKIKDEGILAGHDYTSPENPGVKTAVDEIIPDSQLRIEQTDNNLSVWWVRKNHKLKLD